MALRILPGQANMTCGDCEHREEDGNCPELREVLVQEGFPIAAKVLVPEDASAETCRNFDRSAASLFGESMPGWDERVDTAYKMKVEGA